MSYDGKTEAWSLSSELLEDSIIVSPRQRQDTALEKVQAKIWVTIVCELALILVRTILYCKDADMKKMCFF